MGLLNLAFWVFVAIIAGIYVIMALGLYVQFSLAGLPNFGHVAFMAVAAYTMAILVVRLSLPLGLAALAGIAAAVVLALILGIPSVRLRADYLAIATVAGGEIVRYLAMNLPDLTGGPMGSIALAGPGDIAMYNQGWMASLGGLSALLGVARDTGMALVVWGLTLVLLVILRRLER